MESWLHHAFGPPNVPGKAVGDSQGAWIPTTQVRDLGGVPDSQLEPDSDLAVVAVWQVNQLTEPGALISDAEVPGAVET